MEDMGVLRVLPASKGIKFFVSIPPPGVGVAPTGDVTEEILDDIAALAGTKGIKEFSLYTGIGFTWMLVKGKIPFNRYQLLDGFVQAINDAGLDPAGGFFT